MRALMVTRKLDEMDSRAGFAVRWVRELAKRLERLDVLCQESWPVKDMPDNVRVFSMGKEKGYGRIRQLAAFLRAARTSIPDVDAVFCHMIPRYVWLIAPIARSHGKPVVFWYTHRQVSAELRMAHSMADRIVTAVPESYPLRSDKVVALGHGIDPTVFRPLEPPEEPPMPMVLMVARLSPIKNQSRLIEAAAILKSQGRLADDVAFDFIGEQPPNAPRGYTDSLRSLAMARGLEKQVRFLGAMPQAEVLALTRRCTVAVNLSPPGLFDKAALEAMFCARPVIVANGAFAPLLGTHADLLLVPPGNDPKPLAESLATLLEMTPDERSAIGHDLYRAALPSHSLPHLIDGLIEVMESAATHRSHPLR